MQNPSTPRRNDERARAFAYARPRKPAKVGDPCDAITARGWYCSGKVTVVATDGRGYCKRHAGQAA